jgi:arsenite-transporting ATPase
VSTDPAHSTSDALGLHLCGEVRPVTEGLWGVELDPALEAERYIEEVADRIGQAIPPRLVREMESQLDFARASPGAEEAALFDRFSRIIDEESFDRIVFDTAPSGHTLQLLTLPDRMGAWVDSLATQRRKLSALGKMWRRAEGAAAGSELRDRDVVLEALEERRARFGRVRAALRDSRRTAFVFVTTAERLPVAETHRVAMALEKAGIPVGGLIVNQVLPEGSRDPFLARRKVREASQLLDIEEKFSRWCVVRLPLLDRDPVGRDDLLHLLSRMTSDPVGDAR